MEKMRLDAYRRTNSWFALFAPNNLETSAVTILALPGRSRLRINVYHLQLLYNLLHGQTTSRYSRKKDLPLPGQSKLDGITYS